MNGGVGPRRVRPELMDNLPPTDLRAIRSRTDLQRLNWLMSHASHIQRAAAAIPASSGRSGLRIVELGAGDGTLMLAVARRLAPIWPRAHVILVDRSDSVAPQTLAGFSSLGWEAQPLTRDVFEWLPEPALPVDLMVANLFLHHFEDAQLTSLFARLIAGALLFVACEPRRGAVARAGCGLLRLLGCNEVTRHDAVISVQAGFRGRELSALWPKDRSWRLEERSVGLFSHLFVAALNGAELALE